MRTEDLTKYGVAGGPVYPPPGAFNNATRPEVERNETKLSSAIQNLQSLLSVMGAHDMRMDDKLNSLLGVRVAQGVVGSATNTPSAYVPDGDIATIEQLIAALAHKSNCIGQQISRLEEI